MSGGASFHPKKSLGQNFLKDPAHRARIVAAGDLTRADVVLEIGAGDGSLTALIAAQAGRVVAVELDDRLIAGLEERFKLQSHVNVIRGNILDLEVGTLMSVRSGAASSGTDPDRGLGPDYKVIANLPYYLTSNVVRRLLESAPPPSVMVLTVQREVAERMVSLPPHMSLLAVSVQFYCAAQIVDRIPASAFYPSPRVESAVVRLVRRGEPLFPDLKAIDFFRVVRAGYSQPRKQLRNSLSAGLGVEPGRAAQWLIAAGILPERRAETLTLGEWGRLTAVLA